MRTPCPMTYIYDAHRRNGSPALLTQGGGGGNQARRDSVGVRSAVARLLTQICHFHESEKGLWRVIGIGVEFAMVGALYI